MSDLPITVASPDVMVRNCTIIQGGNTEDVYSIEIDAAGMTAVELYERLMHDVGIGRASQIMIDPRLSWHDFSHG